MNSVLKAMGGFSAAEEFLDYLGVEYEQAVVNVNRLHILKRFNQYLARQSIAGEAEGELKAAYKAVLERAYQDFVRSDAATEKVFKVFQEAGGTRTMSVERVRANLAERQSGA